MKETKYICDYCKKDITPATGSLAILYYQGQLGHNQVPSEGWQYHYPCFSKLVVLINQFNSSLKVDE